MKPRLYPIALAITLTLTFAITSVGCDGAGSRTAQAEPLVKTVAEGASDVVAAKPAVGEPPAPAVAAKPVVEADYPWLAEMGKLPKVARLDVRFPAPSGYKRVDAAAGSYAAWLRGLPVRLDRQTVRSYRGDALGSPAAGIVLLDVGDRDVQQCADSAIRLHAEYLWHVGKANKAGYHFTSGDLSTWPKWRRGERFKLVGRGVKRVDGGSTRGDHAAYRGYLQHLFRYAGTQSLRLDSKAVGASEAIEAGDFFVTPGSPGHAVVVLDVAESPGGERVALIGQGFMPAQEFHVVTQKGSHTVGGVWFALPGAGAALTTPSWSPFPRETARRFTPGR